MLTEKLHITNCSDYELLMEYQSNYTGLFYKLYNNLELLSDKTFNEQQLNQYIDQSIYEICKQDVKTKYKQYQTSEENKLNEIKKIENILENEEFLTKKEKRRKFHLTNKVNRLKRNIGKNITFGGKALQRKITKLNVKINSLNLTLSKLTDKKEIDDIKKSIQEKQELLLKYKTEFKNNRVIGFYFVGRSCEKGNRKFFFDFNSNKVIFKPNRNTSIEIEVNIPKNKRKLFNQLQLLTDERLIPLTVRVKNNHIMFGYDNELLNGFSFNNIECKKQQKLVDTPEEKKEIYKEFITDLENRKKLNKVEGRYISVDLNPKYIGFVIFDKTKKNQVGKIIYKEVIDLSRLSTKLKLSSSDKKQIKQNNKRKTEITNVWKYIFNLVKHYRVYNFVMEDLDFKPDHKDKSNEANRITKNIWHRELTSKLILKYCQNIGLNLIMINPCYSSFIGNLIYDYPDPVAAAMEIGRRGIVKYIKGNSIYPSLSLINQEKLSYLLGENIGKKWTNWRELYAIITSSRWRNPIGSLGKNLESHKSKCVRISA